MHLSLSFGLLYFLQFIVAQIFCRTPYFVSPDYKWKNDELRDEYMTLLNQYLVKILKICCSDDNGIVYAFLLIYDAFFTN